jgi:hypothetical protein
MHHENTFNTKSLTMTLDFDLLFLSKTLFFAIFFERRGIGMTQMPHDNIITLLPSFWPNDREIRFWPVHMKNGNLDYIFLDFDDWIWKSPLIFCVTLTLDFDLLKIVVVTFEPRGTEICNVRHRCPIKIPLILYNDFWPSDLNISPT